MNPNWSKKLAPVDSSKDFETICRGLDRIVYDLNRLENAEAWNALRAMEPNCTRVQIVDGLWWKCYRTIQPIKPQGG